MSEIRAIEMFDAARSLIAGAKIIFDSDGIRHRGQEQKPALPIIVCCALAIEIGIKALLAIVGRSYPREGRGHSLLALFEALPQQIQAEFMTFQERFTNCTGDEAKAKLLQENHSFVNWRSAYDHPIARS